MSVRSIARTYLSTIKYFIVDRYYSILTKLGIYKHIVFNDYKEEYRSLSTNLPDARLVVGHPFSVSLTAYIAIGHSVDLDYYKRGGKIVRVVKDEHIKRYFLVTPVDDVFYTTSDEKTFQLVRGDLPMFKICEDFIGECDFRQPRYSTFTFDLSPIRSLCCKKMISVDEMNEDPEEITYLFNQSLLDMKKCLAELNRESLREVKYERL